jgi:hypothetical protein
MSNCTILNDEVEGREICSHQQIKTQFLYSTVYQKPVYLIKVVSNPLIPLNKFKFQAQVHSELGFC